jgi:hypothetical protein
MSSGPPMKGIALTAARIGVRSSYFSAASSRRAIRGCSLVIVVIAFVITIGHDI